MLFIIAFIVIVLLAIAAFSFAGLLIVKFVFIGLAILIYGGSFLLVSNLIGPNNADVALLISAVIGTVIFVGLIRLNAEQDAISGRNAQNPTVETLTLLMVKSWATKFKNGTVLKIERTYVASTIWSRLLKENRVITLDSEIRDAGKKTLGQKMWRARRLSAELEALLKSRNFFEVTIEDKNKVPEDSPLAPFKAEVKSWLKKVASKLQ
jgi:hypothetical protein